MTKTYLSGVVAMAENRVIGRDNKLPWHIPDDLKHFKKTTMGKPVVMGRKSWESLGKSLPGRVNIVISRSAATKPGDQGKEGPFFYSSLEGAIRAAKIMALKDKAEEVCIIGGGEIFRQTLPKINRLYLTVIHKDYEGDIYFPDFDWNDWNIKSEDRREGDPAFTFYVLERKT